MWFVGNHRCTGGFGLRGLGSWVSPPIFEHSKLAQLWLVFLRNPMSEGKMIIHSTDRQAKGMVQSRQEIMLLNGSFRLCVSRKSVGALGPLGPLWEVTGGWFNGVTCAFARGQPGCLLRLNCQWGWHSSVEKEDVLNASGTAVHVKNVCLYLNDTSLLWPGWWQLLQLCWNQLVKWWALDKPHQVHCSHVPFKWVMEGLIFRLLTWSS